MADTLTTNLSLTKPEPGASKGSWGQKLNANFDVLDAAVLLTSTQALTNKTLTDCVANTQSESDNSTKLATTAYVDTAVATVNEINELLDVTITSANDNDVLAYDNIASKFINQDASEAGLQPTIGDGDLTIARTNGLQAALDAKLPTSSHTKASLDVDHLITLSGVSDAADDLGTFTGSTITDSETVKGALQDLETALETKAASSALTSHTSSTSNPHSVTKTQVGLSNVENTAVSTWAGSTNLTTLGTVGTGSWQGSQIADAYIASAATWNAKATVDDAVALSIALG